MRMLTKLLAGAAGAASLATAKDAGLNLPVCRGEGSSQDRRRR